MLVPTTQPRPFHAADSAVRPAANRSFSSKERVQSACPGSRKNTEPLTPLQASSRDPPAAIAVVWGWDSNEPPKRLQVPEVRFRTQAPEPSEAADRLSPRMRRSVTSWDPGPASP